MDKTDARRWRQYNTICFDSFGFLLMPMVLGVPWAPLIYNGVSIIMMTMIMMISLITMVILNRRLIGGVKTCIRESHGDCSIHQSCEASSKVILIHCFLACDFEQNTFCALSRMSPPEPPEQAALLLGLWADALTEASKLLRTKKRINKDFFTLDILIKLILVITYYDRTRLWHKFNGSSTSNAFRVLHTGT